MSALDEPVTVCIRYKAVLVEDLDEGQLLRRGMVVLRHRHLAQQEHLEQSPASVNECTSSATRGGASVSSSDAEDDLIVERLLVPNVPPESFVRERSESSLSSAASGSADAPQAPDPAERLSTPSALERNDPANSDAGSSRTAGPRPSTPFLDAQVLTQPPHSRSMPGHGTVSGPSRAAPQGEQGGSSLSSPRLLLVRRNERSIRSRGEKTSWFASAGDVPLPAPPVPPMARFCDLYVHTSAGGRRQVWIFANAPRPQWLSVEPGHPHPYLQDYRLNFNANGDPSWVTKDTIRTYRGRMKKREGVHGEGHVACTCRTAPSA